MADAADSKAQENEISIGESLGSGGSDYPKTATETQFVPGVGGADYPHNTSKISDFKKRSRELGQYLDRQVLERAREPVSPEDREAMIQWVQEAKQHTINPESIDVDYLLSDRPLDYYMLNIVFQPHSEMTRDRD
ncbi:MAG: hypothetical protein KY468_07445 [Armatimonadetes bacterium]|nr:hypothetical protein [Armatimonadota bacterium]